MVLMYGIPETRTSRFVSFSKASMIGISFLNTNAFLTGVFTISLFI